jgi:hypothetical protein
LARLDTVASGAISAANSRIVESLEYDDASLEAAATSLINGAAACGALPAKPREIDYINAVLWRGGLEQREDEALRAGQWMDAYRAYVVSRKSAVDRMLAAVGPSQGIRGDVHAIDTVRLSAIISKAVNSLDAEIPPIVPSWCEDAHKKLQVLSRSAPLQITTWRKFVERIRACVPIGVSYVETVDAITAATREGKDQGLVMVQDLSTLMDDNEAARDWDFDGFVLVEKLVERAQTEAGLALLSTVGTSAGVDVAKIANYLESSAHWVDAGVRSAEMSGGAKSDLDQEISDRVERWHEIIRDGGSDD